MAYCILAFLISILLTDRSCMAHSGLHILDLPNKRSLHQNPKPRTGGVAILAGIYLAVGCLAMSYSFPIPLARVAFGGLVIAVVSFVDDCYGVSPLLRLLSHLFATSLVVVPYLSLPFFELPGLHWQWTHGTALLLVTLFLTWMLNLYNFMDGMDGFVAGVTVIGLSVFAFMGWRAGDMAFTLVNLIVAAATLGFWCFNYPPAYIFMGDVGACSLGFFVGILGLWGCEEAIFKPWFALLVFSPLIMDASFTLLLRCLKRERIWKPQRNHFYHRLLLRVGHRKAVWVEYSLMLLCSFSALGLLHRSLIWQQGVLLLWAITYLALCFYICYFEKRYQLLKQFN